VTAQANLRGGGEYGEHWHRAGMLQNKHKVFEDFEAAVGWFSDSGISTEPGIEKQLSPKLYLFRIWPLGERRQRGQRRFTAGPSRTLRCRGKSHYQQNNEH